MKKLSLLVLILVVGVNIKMKAQQKDYKAYSLYVYNFMKYIEWPEEESKGDFIIGVFGESPINSELKNLALNKKLKGRNIVLRKFNSPEEINNCHLLYVTTSNNKLIKSICVQFKDKSTLIIGEREGGVYSGAALSFFISDEDELNFDINKKELENHRLKIASSLVNLGHVVK
jgi:hypothetical protein